jgi:two-component system OmpR family response regulator
MAALLKRDLKEQGYAVDIATTGSEALWHAMEFAYDAVLLDLISPGMSGIELCQQLRSERRLVPILMITARDAVSDRIAGLDAGADDCLVKPFSFDEMNARVRALIRRGSAQRLPELRVADLRLDPATRRAWRGEVELELSTKEYAMLRLFLNNPDVVLSRTMIREHVWDSCYEGSSNVIDQFVLHLRRKIDRPFNVHQLETVRGAGYRLRERTISSLALGATTAAGARSTALTPQRERSSR